MDKHTSRIAAAEQEPYPHFVLENAMPDENLALFLETWPSHDTFSDEIPGNFTRWIDAAPMAPAIWQDFLPACAQELTRTVLASFAPWLLARFGDQLTSVRSHMCLMQAQPHFAGHPIHNHHWHSPNWIATALVYLDADPDGFSGTVINAMGEPGDAHDPAEEFTHTDMWTPARGFRIRRTIDYVQNRMFAFLDGPMSYHSSRPAAPGTGDGRRILRMHLSVPWALCQAKYGVREKAYQALHPRGMQATHPLVRKWVEQDLHELSRPVAISADDALAWANNLEILAPLNA